MSSARDFYDHYSMLEAEETLRLLHGEKRTGIEPRLTGNPTQRRRWLKQLHQQLPFRGVRKFLYLYIWQRGFLDGVAGLMYCLLRASEDFMLSQKLGALRRKLPVKEDWHRWSVVVIRE